MTNISEIKHTDDNNIIYHYTTIEALQGMLFGNKELWLGDSSFMNDTKELTEFIDRLKNEIISSVHNINKEKCNSFFQKVYECAKKNYPYIMSFSKRRDDAAQWERYANNAKGICIGFYKNKLDSLKRKIKEPFFLQTVFYDFNVRKHKHFDCVKNYICDSDLDPFTNEESLIENIVATACSFKNVSFSAEDEIRAIILYVDSPSEFVRVEFEIRNGVIKKYAKIKWYDVCKKLELNIQDLISEIIIGPRSQQKNDILKEYLSLNDYDDLALKVKNSECPLR
ncbi:DUF2971 domain-containing protein [uncultured Ruminococcus sp.]|uniref:DUF2971 domain-containing protein n=1 Tax=uncultured Ruminococcus sp. TaxID=165186 RepID=UPI0026DB9612|nr:DUF2971 domain-containing protein [uncultured Ruminococcus sp.]